MYTLLSKFHSKCDAFVKETVTNSDEGATCLREASIKKNAEDFKGSIHKCQHHR